MSESLDKSVIEKSHTKCCADSDVQTEDGLLVCVNCGQIQRCADQLTNDPSQEYSLNCGADDIKSYVSNNPLFPNRFPVGKRHNTEDVEQLVFNLSLGPEVKIQALTKYKDMIDGHFHHSSKVTKRILAAICVYTSLVSEQTPVTIGHICNTIGCSSSDFNKVYNQVFKEYPNYRSEQLPIERLVSVTISESTIDENEKKIICEKVEKILELCRECWLIEGRSPVHIIFAATFLAWKSIHPYDRRRVGLTTFCQKVNIEYKHTTSQRVTELLNAIKILSESAPLPDGLTITKTNIGIHLDDILQYKSSLFHDFNQKIKGKGREGKNGVVGAGGDPNTKTYDWMNVFKRNQIIPQNNESNVSQSVDPSKKSDEEFSDSEIDLYLRDKSEVKYIKKLKKFVNSCDENLD